MKPSASRPPALPRCQPCRASRGRKLIRRGRCVCAATKRQMLADEQPLPKRKKIRPRRRRVNDEDD
jgi:hypothetical protein